LKNPTKIEEIQEKKFNESVHEHNYNLPMFCFCPMIRVGGGDLI